MRRLRNPDRVSGPLNAWAAALEQFRTGLYLFLARRLRNVQNAQDLSQEVYLRLLRVENPQRVDNPQAYMYRVARNALQEFNAREASSPVGFDSDVAERLAEKIVDESGSAETLCEGHDEGTPSLETLVRDLPPMQRKVILMAACQDLPHAQIAEHLGISVNTVRNHLYRGLLACRRTLSASKRDRGQE